MRLRIALAGLLVLALAGAGWGQWWLHQRRADTARASVVRTAANSTVAAVLSYDYRRLEAGMSDTRKLLVGDARQQYADLTQPLLTTAPKLHAVMQAKVKASTVLDCSASRARVLLFVDQTASSTKLKQPQVDESRIVVSLRRVDGHWLVSELAAV